MSHDAPDHWEQQMTRGLDSRVSGLDESPWTIGDIRGRARRIQRNRRLAASGGVLAVAAVLVPVALLAGPGAQRTAERPPVATTGPSPTTAVESADADPTREPVPPGQETAAGTALGFSWITGDVLTGPEGTTLDLPSTYTTGALIGDTLVAGSESGTATDPFGIDVVVAGRADGATLTPSPEVVANAEHTVAAYVSRSGLIVVGTDGGSEPLNGETNLLPRNVVPVALTGTCTPRAAGGETAPTAGSTGTCRVFYDDGRFEPGSAKVMEPSGEISTADPSMLAPDDATEDGLIAGVTEYSVDEVCSTVRRDGADVWAQTCDYAFLDFSPDGSYITATDPAVDGLGGSWVAILDAQTGEEVARMETDGVALQTPTWIGDDEIVVPGFDGGGWSLRTLDTTDAEAVVARTSAGDDVTPGLVVPDQD